jgi:DivIVA domain-containing protein
MGDKIVLTPQDILDREFKIDARGYRLQEVDQFLDVVIKDYQEFVSIIKRYENDCRALLNDNSRLKTEIRDLRSKLDIAGSNKDVTNIDIIKRISELEKIVYGDNE